MELESTAYDSISQYYFIIMYRSTINRASKVRRKTTGCNGHKHNINITSPAVLPSLENKSVTNNEPSL